MPTKACDHSQTRLTCVDCNSPICPKCMVMCAVGNRCKKCTKGFETSLTKLTPLIVLKVVLLSFVSSFLIFLAEIVVGLLGIPYIGCMLATLAACICSYFCGKFIHNVSGNKYGPKLVPFVLIPLLLGFIVNPLGSPLGYLIACLALHSSVNFEAVLSFLYLPVLSCFTILIPLLRVK